MHEIYHQPTLADTDPERAKEAARVTIVGAVVNVILAIGKLVAGIIGQSAAMVADAVHSLSDLVTDAVTLLSVKYAAKGADEKHPYGHGRAETIGSAITGACLALVGLFMIFEIGEDLIAGTLNVPTWPAIVGALASIVIKEWLYHYTVAVGKRQNNQSLVANAWHHRSDAISSVAALLGIGGAMMGFPILDPLAAIVVVFMIAKVGWDISAKAISDLMDSALPPERISAIRAVIMKTDGVRRYHELRTRQVGGDVFVDVHILAPPTISVSEAHNIAENVRHSLKEEAGITDALVHIDAEDDIHYKVLQFNRTALQDQIVREAAYIPGVRSAAEVTIHMLNGLLCADFVVELDDAMTIGEAQKRAADLQARLVKNSELHTAVVRARLTENVEETGFLDPPPPVVTAED